MSLFPAQESDLERWDQLCGDGREDESKDGEVQDGGQIVKEENPSVSSSHGIFVPRLSSFNFCLINFVKRGLKMYQTTSNFRVLPREDRMASALGNLMANYTDSEGEEMAEGGSEGEGEGNPSLADR